MGALQSSQMQEIATILNQQTINQVSNYLNQAEATCEAIQRNTVTTGRECQWVNHGKAFNVTLSNQLDQNCKISGQGTQQITNNISTIISNALENTLNQKTDAVQEFLTLSFGAQANWAEAISDIQNIITTDIDINAVNKCGTSALINQEGGVNFCGENYADINLVLTNQATQTASGMCIAGIVFDTIISNDYLNNLVQTADQQMSLQQQGIGSAWIAIVVVVVVVAVVGIILLVIFLRPKPGQKKSPLSSLIPGSQILGGI